MTGSKTEQTEVKERYPVDFPRQYVANLIDIITKGELQKRMAEAVKAAWIMLGYVFGASLGDPDSPVMKGEQQPLHAMSPMPMSCPRCTQSEAVKELQTLLDVDSGKVTAGPAAISPQLIMWLFDLIIRQLMHK